MDELVHVCKPGTQESELGEWRAGDRLSGHSESLSHPKQKRKQTNKKKKGKKEKEEKYNYYPTSVPLKPNAFKDQPWGKTEDPYL